MPSTSEIATHYFECVSRQDIPGMVACWKPGSRATFVGMDELNAPEDYDQWFGNLFGCFPDFKLEAQSIVAEGEQASVHWRATGTFNGEGIFEGFRPNGASIDIEGVDLVTLEDGKIVHITAILNGLDMARQLGAVPAKGSIADKAMAAAFNTKTATIRKLKSLRN
ncbi:MAG TPA: ester cyclase [Solirubrobacterales bacterium]|jgi:predicted ester cyclase|nr:ester cyclase [Solirubrobacterales bacterium]HMW45813.1 ester cyclase [Solirubrobacterales bacterium]HMX72382.1 ester cyclase [Solirubrobacterales bacterium]HMY25628.1 ester cyclase [Solirubrobacterales bacterium]HNA24985.1 ester cyclase [Solirubrobacterales bacterium]